MIYVQTWCRQHETIGTLSFNQFTCFTLELPWKNNESNASCIPAGIYPYKVIVSPTSGKQVLRLDLVPGRSLINVETANFVQQLKGCICVGKDLTFLNTDHTIDLSSTSAATLAELIAMIPSSGRIAFDRVGHGL